MAEIVFCMNCTFWKKRDDIIAGVTIDPEIDAGECRRKSPHEVKEQFVTKNPEGVDVYINTPFQWPMTFSNDYCGEGQG